MPGQFDSQGSLQLYGGGIGTNPSPGDVGVVTTVANNMQSTQASTIPTQQVGGLSKKGRGKHAVAGVKGGQKRIPTNQKQLQTRKKIVGPGESESTSADQQSNDSKNQAYDMIQKRIREANQKQQAENMQNYNELKGEQMFDLNSDEGRDDGHIIMDELDQEDGEERDEEPNGEPLDPSRPSDGMSKIQQHLQATIGKSKNYEMDEGAHSSDGKSKKDHTQTIEYEAEPSARIEHNNIDGSLQLNIDQE